MCGGWIKSHRKILEWEWVHDPPTRDLFWYLLHKAAYEDTEVDGVILHPGECLDGQRSIAKFLGFGYQEIRTAQLNLEKSGEISVFTGNDLTHKLTHDPTQDLTHARVGKRTLYKVNNWSLYQQSNAPSNAHPNAPSNTPDQNPSLYIIKEDFKKESKKSAEAPSAAAPKPKKSDPELAEWMQIICKHFTDKTGKRALPTSKGNVSFVKARKAEGYALEDFLHVIDVKSAQWNDDPKMNQYLRFKTLFGSNMDGYVNEGSKNKPKESDPVRLW